LSRKQDFQPIDYKDYISDMTRISHETDFLNHVPETKQVMFEVGRSSREQVISDLRQQIRNRKQVIAGLDTEITELKQLIKDLEER